MAEEELETELADDEPEEPPEADLDELSEDDLDVPDDDDDDDVLDDETLDEEDDLDLEVPSPDAPHERVAVPAVEADEEEEDEEEEVDDEDVEASLDVILKERLVVIDDDDLEEGDDRTEPAVKVLPKQPGEFVCQSCFLVKHPSQLADPDKMFCRDCV